MKPIYARQCILTRFLPPTDHRDPRIVAEQSAPGPGRIVMTWNDELSPAQNHTIAGMKLARKLGWVRDGQEIHLAGARHGGYLLCFVHEGSRIDPDEYV